MRMPYMNTQRFYCKLREAQLDAFLVFKPENFYYTTGFQNYFGGVATGVVRQAQAIVVLPADRQMKPSMTQSPVNVSKRFWLWVIAHVFSFSLST